MINVKVLHNIKFQDFETDLNAFVNDGWIPNFETFRVNHIINKNYEIINYYIILIKGDNKK
jgi:hypothetical protein